MIDRTAPACRGASVLGLVLALLAFSGSAACAAPPELKAWRGPAPKFALADAQGAQHALAAGPVDITIVHFFATWCESCRTELPSLVRLAKRAGPGARVIAISVAEPDMRVRRFLAKSETGFPVLLDRDRSVARAWGVATLPTSFVLDGALAPMLAAQTTVDWDRFEPQQISTQATSAEAR